MAQAPSATAVLLLLSLLAVSHCRTLESDPATDGPPAESTSVAVPDEIGTGPSNPTVVSTEAVPAERDGFLRLPSHRSHRHQPCRHGIFHRHLWWARHHHGVFGDGHRFHHHGDADLVRYGEPSRVAEAAEEEVKPVAEPDPDSDSEDGSDDTAAVKRWRKEMLWRMFRHGLRHHRHHHHHEGEEEDHEQEEEGAAGVKRFRHHPHDDEEEEDEEKERKMTKLFHFHHRHHDEDEEEKMRKPLYHADHSDDEDDEMVRRFRKAIMRRRFHHRGHSFRHHGGHHHHAEEAEQSGGEQQQEGGVTTWIKGLMNRF